MLEVGLGPLPAVPLIPGLGVFKEVSVALPRWGQCLPGNTPQPVHPHPGSGWAALWQAEWLSGYQ